MIVYLDELFPLENGFIASLVESSFYIKDDSSSILFIVSDLDRALPDKNIYIIPAKVIVSSFPELHHDIRNNFFVLKEIRYNELTYHN